MDLISRKDKKNVGRLLFLGVIANLIFFAGVIGMVAFAVRWVIRTL